jgi:hypothetical protein
MGGIFENLETILDESLIQQLKELIEKYPDEFGRFEKGIEIAEIQKLKNFLQDQSLKDSNLKTLETNPAFVFNQADKQGLWYNWATGVGEKYTGVSYSPGSTYIFNKTELPKPPEILIFSNDQVNNTEQKFPLYTLVITQEQQVLNKV